jgi:hypothetical protein
VDGRPAPAAAPAREAIECRPAIRRQLPL